MSYQSRDVAPRVVVAALLAAIQMFGAHQVRAQDTVTVTPGARYQAGSLHRLIFGSKYRDLWDTEIRVPVFDLSAHGGMTPVRKGGFGQTLTLRFEAPAGRELVFRTVDKNRGQGLAEIYRNSLVEDIIQDQTSSLHPAAALVVAPLLEAADLLHAVPEFGVLPDDPRLGEFREEFAGRFGMIEERPQEGLGNAPGFAGSTDIIGTDTFLERIEDEVEHRVDARAFLAARLMDLLMGDRDRHADQWRWARFREGDTWRWVTIPRDRDEAFVGLDGVMLFFLRGRNPKLQSFGVDYPDLYGLTWNAWDLDRRLLSELPRLVFDSVALELQRKITDSVIEHAVAQMPVPMYQKGGAYLIGALKNRRDLLPEAAAEWYRMLAQWVEVHVTDEDELAVVEYPGDGEMQVSVYRRPEEGLEPVGEPHFSRRFHAEETREVRLWLHGGDDVAVIEGSGVREVLIRVLGGGSDDELIDRTDGPGLPVRFYDDRGDNRFVRTSHTSVDQREYDRPPGEDPFHEHHIDWGSRWYGATEVWNNSQHGFTLQPGWARFGYGFRKHPYSSLFQVNAGVSTTGRPVGRIQAHWVEVIGSADLRIRLGLSGAHKMRFFGFGNQTPNLNNEFANVDQYRYWFEPELILKLTETFSVGGGAVAKINWSPDDDSSFVAETLPYGVGVFGQVGVQSWFEFDGRNQVAFPTKGLWVRVGGSAYPAAGDVEEVFGEVHGSVAGYLGAESGRIPTLGVRIGGKKVWGRVPFHESAFLGGGSTLRGYSRNRFAGDASVYGNAELRIPVGNVRLINIPWEVGVIALADAGRVFLDGEESGVWHADGGGGIWAAPFTRANTISATLSHGEETRLHLSMGFQF